MDSEGLQIVNDQWDESSDHKQDHSTEADTMQKIRDEIANNNTSAGQHLRSWCTKLRRLVVIARSIP